jgi:uncharacterized protein YoxC
MSEITILILLSVAVLLFVLFAIPLLIQIRRTAKGLEETAAILNRDLPPILQNLRQITTDVNHTTTIVQRDVAEISLTLRRIQGIIGVILGVGEVLRHQIRFPLGRRLMTVLAVVKGVRTFTGVLTGRDRA